jgi:UDP-2,3-diacylglucosamine pyrophosphatase LpxH
MMELREVEVAVISDLHLGTYACKPKKVLKYLKSILPKILILNGDIIDSWRFSRNYFPKNHLKVIRQIIKMIENGVQVYYITGNHDEFLRKFTPLEMGNLKIVNQLVLDLNGLKTWIFHGDIPDSKQYVKWLAKLGAKVKGLLSVFNKLLNKALRYFGKKEIILYRSIKYRLIGDIKNISKLEEFFVNAAISQKFHVVICGHTHVPKDKAVFSGGQLVRYLNCGDWVENFTAAEYKDGDWRLFFQTDQEEELQSDEFEIPEWNPFDQSFIRILAFTHKVTK